MSPIHTAPPDHHDAAVYIKMSTMQQNKMVKKNTTFTLPCLSQTGESFLLTFVIRQYTQQATLASEATLRSRRDVEAGDLRASKILEHPGRRRLLLPFLEF